MSYRGLGDVTNDQISRALYDLANSKIQITDSNITALEGLINRANNEDLEQLKVTAKHLDRLLIAESVNSFLTFLNEILAAVFRKYPFAFFRRKLEAEVVFQATDLKELQEFLVEQAVRDLSYKSILDLRKSLISSLSIDIFGSDLQALRIQRLVYSRNVIAHNRGLANAFFLENTRDRRNKLGQPIAVPTSSQIRDYLFGVEIEIDHRIVSKFELFDEDLMVQHD